MDKEKIYTRENLFDNFQDGSDFGEIRRIGSESAERIKLYVFPDISQTAQKRMEMEVRRSLAILYDLMEKRMEKRVERIQEILTGRIQELCRSITTEGYGEDGGDF